MGTERSSSSKAEPHHFSRLEVLLNLSKQVEVFDLMRVFGLLFVAEQMERPESLPGLAPEQRKRAMQDVLRAAVVLMHAQLEEYLRNIERVLLPEASQAGLNQISLAGIVGRKTTFSLGDLVHHKGKRVDELLKESVSEHLADLSYHSTAKIIARLGNLGLHIPEEAVNLAAIDEMINRRHEIVHRADRTPSGTGDDLQDIQAEKIGNWLKATIVLTLEIDKSVRQELLRLDESPIAHP